MVLQNVLTPFLPESYDQLETKEVGVLEPIATKVIMKVLYAARMARYDLLKAVQNLASRVTSKMDSIL